MRLATENIKADFGQFMYRKNLTSVKSNLKGYSAYFYGFQGQEMDDEVKGKGNSINYKYRMHDPRVGRFFAVDPLTKDYPHYSPYSFSGNKVIAWAELEGLEEVLVIREQVNKSEYKLTYIWDITARERGERGKIQYYDADNGDLTSIRYTNPEEKQLKIIKQYLGTPITEKAKKATFNSSSARKIGIERIDENGNSVPYKVTGWTNYESSNVGENETYYRDDLQFKGITSKRYNMSTFNAASGAEKRNITQPSAQLSDHLDELAKAYVNGEIRDIKVQINTDRNSTVRGIEESNNLRRQAIVDYLVNKGVDKASIKTLNHQYNKSDWDANVSYDKTK